jgi:glycosyltransferase involved in cell wall biosynthesis
MQTANRTVLLVGNFLSASISTRSVCEDLADRLESARWSVIRTSAYQNRVRRLADMLLTTWRNRHRYYVAQMDVYSGLSFIWAEVVCRLLRQLGKPYILTLHGGNLPVFARQSPERVRRLLRSAAAVTTPSRYLWEEMRPYRDPLILLPNPLDISAYCFEPRQHPRPEMMWLRAFHTIYHPALAVEVVARMVGQFPDIHLTMIGPDKHDGSREETLHRAAENGVADRIEFAGQIAKADVPRRIKQGDIFLNTSRVDNTPISVMEAMASGLCVVSANVGGIPYFLEDGRDSLLVPSDDAVAMADAVRRILTEPGLAESLSRAARAKVEQHDWSQILPQWETLLASESKKS